MNPPFFTRFRSEISLLMVATVWGTNFVVVKLVLGVMHPHVMNVFRLLASGMVLALAHHKRQQSRGERFLDPIRRYPLEVVRISLIGWFLYQMAFILGVDNTTPGSAAIIMASLPLWTALLSFALRIERLNRVMWAGLAVCVLGTMTVVLSGNQNVDLGSEYLLGNIIILVAAILWGANTVLTKPLVERVTPIGIAVMGIIIAWPLLCLISIPYWSDVDWGRVTPIVWLAILFSGSLSTGIAIVFWNSGVQKLGASHTAVFQNLVPFIALIMSYFVLGDIIMPGQVIGGVLTIAGLVVMRRGRESRRTPAADRH